MIEVLETEAFSEWFASLRDRSGRNRIEARIVRLRNGNMGDVAPVGEGVSELRIHHGPGYRVYFVHRGKASSSCWAAATRPRRAVTSPPPRNWPKLSRRPR